MNKVLWVKLVFYIYTLAFTVGVYLEFGLGWALMAGGLIGALVMLFVVEADEKKAGKT